MSAHVLLNLLNKLGKRDKKRGLPRILSLFRNKLDKYKTSVRIDLSYDIKITLKSNFWRNKINFVILSLCTHCCYGSLFMRVMLYYL